MTSDASNATSELSLWYYTLGRGRVAPEFMTRSCSAHIFHCASKKAGGGFLPPRCIPHRPGISRANKPPACHISTGVSLAPRREIPNHSFPFLNWHTQDEARKRLVSYKRETGRGNWEGEQIKKQINLITKMFLTSGVFVLFRSYRLVSDFRDRCGCLLRTERC